MKKFISIILCLILVLSMAATAFAATSIPGTWAPPNPGFNQAPQNPVSRIVVDVDDEEPEENPTTGAPVLFAVPAVIAAIGAAAVIGKRK